MAGSRTDQITYLDRRNSVLKLSQGEFVTVAKLEALFGDSPLVGRSPFTATAHARICWRWSYLRPCTQHDVELKPLIWSRCRISRRLRG